MRTLLSIIILCCSLISLNAQKKSAAEPVIPILIRCDDWGMNHAVNMAAKKVLDAGFPVSASVMFTCPWYQEAVALLKNYSNVSVGIHLTLNAEWKNFRWGPVAGRSAVPTLVDSEGFFFPSRALLFGNNPSLKEIEMELRAQIERALRSGVRIDYMDYHMGAAMQNADTRAIVEKLAAQYHLAISRYFDEVDVDDGYAAPVENKLDTLMKNISAMAPGGTKLFVFHVGTDNDEMKALVDLNPFGPKEMSRHRQSELNALLSEKFQSLVHSPKYRLVNYKTLIDEKGLSSMKKPKDL